MCVCVEKRNDSKRQQKRNPMNSLFVCLFVWFFFFFFCNTKTDTNQIRILVAVARASSPSILGPVRERSCDKCQREVGSNYRCTNINKQYVLFWELTTSPFFSAFQIQHSCRYTRKGEA